MSYQLSSASTAVLRACARQQLPTNLARSAAIAAGQQRGVANAGAKSAFESPFGSSEEGSTLRIPNFKKYKSNASPSTNKVFSYFVAGTMGLGSAVGAKATVQGTLATSVNAYWQCNRHRLKRKSACIPGSSGLRPGCSNITTKIIADQWPPYRLPRQHVRLCRRPGSGQG